MQEVKVKRVWPGTMTAWPDGGKEQRTVTFLGERVASDTMPLPKETVDLYRTPQGFRVVYHEDGGKVIYPTPDSDYSEEQVSEEFPDLWRTYKGVI